MGQTELRFFLIQVSVIILIFIIGILFFIVQYRRRKIMHEKEKNVIEEQNRVALLNAQVDAQQQTMQFIGSEIHDSVAQKLTLASIYSQRLEFENEYPNINGKLASISRIINDSLTELRDLSKNLTDRKLQQSVFSELLQTECERINNTGICRAVVQYDAEIIIPVSVKSFLFRIVQEFIQNSLRHSGCSLITIDAHKSHDGIELKMSDNGKGFDLSAINANGMGMNNMKRRIDLIGGSYKLESDAGTGTRLYVFMPNKMILL